VPASACSDFPSCASSVSVESSIVAPCSSTGSPSTLFNCSGSSCGVLFSSTGTLSVASCSS